MRALKADLWETQGDLRVITTNGTIRRDGAAVMGRGCALEAKRLYPGLEHTLGALLQEHGNRVMRLYGNLACFPVKHNWWEYADLKLIETSTKQLVELADKFGYEDILLPRPGCGNGGLAWREVKLVVEPLLDDRFVVITK